jgi:hypothetical protein
MVDEDIPEGIHDLSSPEMWFDEKVGPHTSPAGRMISYGPNYTAEFFFYSDNLLLHIYVFVLVPLSNNPQLNSSRSSLPVVLQGKDLTPRNLRPCLSMGHTNFSR